MKMARGILDLHGSWHSDRFFNHHAGRFSLLAGLRLSMLCLYV